MQTLQVQFGVVLHHRLQRDQLAIVHVGGRARHLAQTGHLELAEVAVRGLHMAGFHGLVFPCCVCRVSPAGQQVEGAGLQRFDAAEPPGIHHARTHEEVQADVGELPMREARAAVAELAVAAADEQLQAALGRRRVTRRGGTVTPGEGVAELVEGRAP
jgi:hypothetical protein